MTCKLNKYPVILFWFGTCSLTQKINGLFVVKDDLDNVVASVISLFKTIKAELLSLNHRAKIIFLECPYYSLSMFNSHRRSKFPTNFVMIQQRQLVTAIDNLNTEIRIINGSAKVPNFNKDFTTRTHRKQPARLVYDYSQLRDGCHMGKRLSELWLIRIHRLIYRI